MRLHTECEVGWPETNGVRDDLFHPSTSTHLLLVLWKLSSQEASCVIVIYYGHLHWVLNKWVFSLTVSTVTWFTGLVKETVSSVLWVSHVAQRYLPPGTPQAPSEAQHRITEWKPDSFFSAFQVFPNTEVSAGCCMSTTALLCNACQGPSSPGVVWP